MIDEVTKAYLERRAQARGKPLEEMTPGEARKAREFLLPLFGKGPEMASVEEVQHGSFTSRLLVPHGETKGTIVWLHGGGRLIVGGDSAGGNLTAVVCRRARDQKGPKIAMQLLVYPVTDANFETATYRDKESQIGLTREEMIWFWSQYAPDDPLHPDASPLRAADLSRLPPAVVLTAECDVLRDDGESYAKALIAAGVPVTFRRFAGQIHGFFVMVNVLPAQADGLEFVARAIDASS